MPMEGHCKNPIVPINQLEECAGYYVDIDMDRLFAKQIRSFAAHARMSAQSGETTNSAVPSSIPFSLSPSLSL